MGPRVCSEALSLMTAVLAVGQRLGCQGETGPSAQRVARLCFIMQGCCEHPGAQGNGIAPGSLPVGQ